jgi:hypothetical protein
LEEGFEQCGACRKEIVLESCIRYQRQLWSVGYWERPHRHPAPFALEPFRHRRAVAHFQNEVRLLVLQREVEPCFLNVRRRNIMRGQARFGGWSTRTDAGRPRTVPLDGWAAATDFESNICYTVRTVRTLVSCWWYRLL